MNKGKGRQMLAFQCLHKIYQIHYESNIKVNISNTIDNFYGAPLDYHCAKKTNKQTRKKFCIDIISVYVFSSILHHFPNFSKIPKGSLKQLVDDKYIYC